MILNINAGGNVYHEKTSTVSFMLNLVANQWLSVCSELRGYGLGL